MKSLVLLAGIFAAALSPYLCNAQAVLNPSQLTKGDAAPAFAAADLQPGKLAQIARHWDEMSSPGTSFTLREIQRSPSPDGQFATYRMYVTGVPAGQTWTLLNLTLAGEISPALDGITFDGNGLAVCAGLPGTCGDASKPNDPIDLRLLAARGEAKRMALVSRDGQTRLTASVVPFPAEGSDKSCHLELLLGTPDAQLLLVSGEGFPPNQWLRIQSSSEGELIATAPQNVSASGHIFFAIMPYVENKAAGDVKVSVLNGAGCTPSASIHWGQGTYKMM